MTKEDAIKILNTVLTFSERHCSKEIANECLRMAIEALKTQPCEDCISRKAVLVGLASIAKAKAKSDAQKSLMGRVMFFTEHLPSVAPQPKAEGARGDIPLQQSVPKMPQPKEEPKADKALNLLAEWAIECGFGFDNIPEEYEKYKDDIAEMGYAEGLVYIVKMESEEQYGRNKA